MLENTSINNCLYIIALFRQLIETKKINLETKQENFETLITALTKTRYLFIENKCIKILSIII